MSLEQELLRQIDEVKSGAENKRAIAQPVHQRERGMWSFLTWSFFLSQLVSSGLLSTGAAKAADAPELASGSDEDGAAGAQGSLSSASDEVATTDETPEATTTATVSGLQRGEIGNLQAKVAVLGVPDGETAQQQDAAEEVATTASGGGDDDDACGCSDAHHDHANHGPAGDDHDHDSTVSVVVGNDGDTVVADAPGDVVAVLDEDVVNPGSDLVETVTDDVLPPVTETVSDLLDTVTDDVLTPVLNPIGDLVETVADNVLSPVTDTAGGLLQAVTDDVVNPVLEPVGTIVSLLSDDVLSPVLEPATELVAQVVDDVLSPVTQPVLDLVSDVAGDVLFPVAEPIFEVASIVTDPILEPVEDVVETVVEPLSAVLNPVTDIASPILDPVTNIVDATPLGGLFSSLLGGSGTSESPVSSDGTMAFAPASADTGNDLFQDGGYTQYGLALQTDGEPETGSAVDSGSEGGDQIALGDLFDTDGTDDSGTLNLSRLLGGTVHHLSDGLFA